MICRYLRLFSFRHICYHSKWKSSKIYHICLLFSRICIYNCSAQMVLYIRVLTLCLVSENLNYDVSIRGEMNIDLFNKSFIATIRVIFFSSENGIIERNKYNDKKIFPPLAVKRSITVITIWHADLFWENINIHWHFSSSLNTEMARAVTLATPCFETSRMTDDSALRWRHNGRDSVSNHQPHGCLLNRYSNADQRKHQSSASLAFVTGDRLIPRTNGQ